MKDTRYARKQQQELQELQGQHSQESRTSASNYAATIRKRDDTLATQVARREVLRVAQLHVIETARANERTSSGIARVGTPSSTSRLEEWVNGVIGTPVSPLPTLPVPPDGVPEGIQRAMRQLEQARTLGANVARHSPNSSRLNIQQPVIDVSDTQKSATPSRKRRRQRHESTEPTTPSIRRLPLAERDLNADKILTFTPISKRGRIRKATPKGLENFCIDI